MNAMARIEDILEMLGLGNTQPTREQGAAALTEKIETLDRLWEGDDVDAATVRAVLPGLKQVMMLLVGEKPLAVLLAKALEPAIKTTMDTIDALTDLGVVRAMARGNPIPGTKEWNPPAEEPMQAASMGGEAA